MSDNREQTQPSSPSFQSLSFHIILQTRDTRTVVFEHTQWPLTLETLLSHTERDKSERNTKGSDSAHLQRQATELLMPASETVTSRQNSFSYSDT